MRRSIPIRDSIAIIGLGSQSKRIQNILKNLDYKYFLYHYSKKDYVTTFEDLKKCKIIFICSPNKTHFYYIKKLSDSYIFCEKPPVNSLKDLKSLSKMNHKKLYFNYNFRFSEISKILNNLNKYKLGKLLYGNIIIGHGLASKKEYANSWRANKKLCPKGVFEIVSTHIIDLFNFHFEIETIQKPKLYNFSKKGSSYDTSSVLLTLKNKSTINIFSSYFCPYHEEWTLVFENGIVKFQNDSIFISGPRDNLDKNNFFIKPKLILKKTVSPTKDYENSLKESVKFFLKNVKKNKIFKKNLFNKSIEANKLIL